MWRPLLVVCPLLLRNLRTCHAVVTWGPIQPLCRTLQERNKQKQTPWPLVRERTIPTELTQERNIHKEMRARGSVVVKALRYKPKGHEFETRWGPLGLQPGSLTTRPQRQSSEWLLDVLSLSCNSEWLLDLLLLPCKSECLLNL
jgi:hypothetical protein